MFSLVEAPYYVWHFYSQTIQYHPNFLFQTPMGRNSLSLWYYPQVGKMKSNVKLLYKYQYIYMVQEDYKEYILEQSKYTMVQHKQYTILTTNMISYLLKRWLSTRTFEWALKSSGINITGTLTWLSSLLWKYKTLLWKYKSSLSVHKIKDESNQGNWDK